MRTRASRRSRNVWPAPTAAAAATPAVPTTQRPLLWTAFPATSAPTFKCAPGGDKTADAINTIMGNATDDRPSLRATVICAGGENCGKRFDYQGIQTCAAAASIAGGPSACAYGCLGLGDCTRACKFDAIHIINGVAVVDRKKCTGCTACTVTCPRHVIQMKPIAPQPAVKCSNKDKGALVNKTCKVGCIATIPSATAAAPASASAPRRPSNGSRARPVPSTPPCPRTRF